MKDGFAVLRIVMCIMAFLAIANLGPVYMGWSGFEAYVAGIFAAILVRTVFIDLEFAIYEAIGKEAN